MQTPNSLSAKHATRHHSLQSEQQQIPFNLLLMLLPCVICNTSAVDWKQVRWTVHRPPPRCEVSELVEVDLALCGDHIT